jgi:hypothetical protein
LDLHVQLNEETRRICSMLLMLPMAVLVNIKQVKTFVDELSSSLTMSDEDS